MPEYSSTTLTPADAIQTPAMNGNTPGNYTLSALKSYILTSLGQANGIATLDSNGKLTSTQIPDLAKDVLFYSAYASFPSTGTEGKIYVDKATLFLWYWNGSAYVKLTDIVQSITDGDTTHAPSVDAVHDALAMKQDALTFDASPTQSSTNPVTSGGVYTAVQDVQGQIDDLGLSVVNGQLYMTYDE